MVRLTNSLFARIFIWFWVLLTLVTAVNILVLWLMDTPAIRDDRMVRDAESLRIFGSAVLDIYAQGRTEVVEERAREYARTFRLELFLVNEEGEVLFGENLPQETIAPAARALQEGRPQTLETEEGLWLFTRIVDSEGRSGVAATKRPKRHWVPHPFRPHILVQRFLIGVFLSGLLAWFFAGSLAKPIARLKESTRRLAEGDLEVRTPTSISRRKDEIGDLGREFDVMAGQIQELLASRDQLLRDISHELRSPLARLGVALELVYQKATPEMETSLDRIKRESEKLNDLIGQLLTLSSLQGGSDLQKKNPFELDGVIETVAADADFEAKSRDRGVKIIQVEPVTVKGQKELIHQAVENVVRNGLVHTQERTNVEISLEKQEVQGETLAVIRVRDHGPGVPEHLLDNIFQPFFRVAEARERQTGGTGVGLAITRRAVELHGGTVTASNARDGGLFIEIKLPV